MCSLPVLLFFGGEVSHLILDLAFIVMPPHTGPLPDGRVRFIFQADCGGEGEEERMLLVWIAVTSESSVVRRVARIQETKVPLFRETAYVSSNGQAGAF